MIKAFINGNDRSAYVDAASISIKDQIQNKANTASFSLFPGVPASPEENQEVFLYDGVIVISASGTEVIVEDKLSSGLSILATEDIALGSTLKGNGRGKFRAGDKLWIDVNNSDEEKVVISAIEEHTVAGQVKITLVESLTNSHSAGEFIGKRIFGGIISSIRKQNTRLLSQVEYICSCVDFTKIFDKKLVNDTWANVSGRYIINDFLNTTINLNSELDDMNYDDNTAVQAEWIESGDGDNPTNVASGHIQGSGMVRFPWTNSGGIATFTGTPPGGSYSALTGATSGDPLEGNITFYYQQSDPSVITSLAIRVGSSASDYVQVTVPLENTTDLKFVSVPLLGASKTGTPDWTNLDYLAFVITETGNGNISIDDVRMTANGSFTAYNVEDSPLFQDVRASFKKPTVFMDNLSKVPGYFYYIDYERDIHYFSQETNTAPFEITESSDNFDNLQISADTSQLKNRQAVRGGEATSDETYSQVFPGDDAKREWVLKNKFKNLQIFVNKGTTTGSMEVGTTTTNIAITGHGLVTGDWIVNDTRGAARQVVRVDDDNLTVEAVAGQTNGDTYSLFDVEKTSAVENLADEASFDYMQNSNEKSVKATDSESTLLVGEYILFIYNERIKIRTQVIDTASIALMKSIIGGDGIFDGAPINDQTLDTLTSARDRGNAELLQYSNPIITVTFTTDHEGLESGQLIHVVDSNRSIDDSYMIQSVSIKYRDDYPTYQVTAASSLFGIIEYFQKLSRASDLAIDDQEIIDQIITESIIVTVAEVNTLAPSIQIQGDSTVTVTPSETSTLRNMTTDPYKWQPHASDARWNLAQWG